MTARTGWKEALNPQERSELRELDKKIKLQEAVAGAKRVSEQRKLVYLKHQRKLLQNRVTIRNRRSSVRAAAEMAAAE